MVSRNECLFIVDAVETLGAVKLYVDDWKIDVAYSTSQKALGARPGLAPITISANGMEKLNNRKKKIQIPHWDIKLLLNAWETYDESQYL